MSHHLNVKICGITTIEDAMLATAAGADLLGFIFYPKSPRLVTAAQTRAITDAVRAASSRPPRFVGVFVDEDWQTVARILDDAGLDLAQLHGSEPPVELDMLSPRAFKALRPQGRADIESMIAAYSAVLPPTDPSTASRPSFLIDAYHPWQFGGTGKTTDWRAVQPVALRVPLLLAGGLTPDNVAEAIATVQPWGVDVSSGVERAPGHKDPALVHAFIKAAKQAIE